MAIRGRRPLPRAGAAVGIAIAASLATATIAGGAGATATAVTPEGSVGGPATAGLYGWGATTETDGSVLIGDYWNYRIVHFEASGAKASPYVFAGKLGYGPGTNQAPYGLGVDPFNGDVYMAEGSEPDVNVYDKNGNFITSYGTNAVHFVNFTYPGHVAVNPVNENVYVVDQWAGDIDIINPKTQSLVSTFGSGQLIQPRGIAFDSSGNFWVADQGHHRIVIYNQKNAIVKTIAPPGGVSTSFEFRGLAIDTSHNVAYVVNNQGCRIQEFNASASSGQYGAYMSQFGSCGTGNGQFEDGGRDITVDGSHNIWVGDLGNFRVQVFSPSGAFLFAEPAPPSPPPTGGFNGPRGAAFDSSGDLFVTDTYNERVEKFTPTSGGGYAFSLAWGLRGENPDQFNYPRLMCFDPANGLIIIANTDSNEIVAYTTNGVYQWVGTGLADPYGVACAPNGTIYAADSNNHDIAVFNSSGKKTGTIGTNLGFDRGIWVDTDGSIWVSSMASGKIFHFAAGGTQLGTFNVGATSMPFGIAGDAGYLYIALSSSNEVAQYTRGGMLVSTFKAGTPQGLVFSSSGRLFVVEEGSDVVGEWTVP
jgi:DNA-binding beta-propeller fold protein YncE